MVTVHKMQKLLKEEALPDKIFFPFYFIFVVYTAAKICKSGEIIPILLVKIMQYKTDYTSMIVSFLIFVDILIIIFKREKNSEESNVLYCASNRITT